MAHIQDRKEVSKQEHEIRYISKKFKVPVSEIWYAKTLAYPKPTSSRKKIYAYLRSQGYNIPVNEWTYVKDKLPRPNADIYFTKGKFTFQGWYNKDMQAFVDNKNFHLHKNVTKWQLVRSK